MELQPWPRRAAQVLGILAMAAGVVLILVQVRRMRPPEFTDLLPELASAVAGIALMLGGRKLLAWGSG